MKNLLTLTIMLFTAITLTSASEYENKMLKGIEMLQAANNVDASNAATNYFERLAQMYTQEWLPLYYAAYSSLKSGFQQESSETRDEYYKKGLAFIERAKGIRSNESEILTMEAYLKLMYISNDAMKRAVTQTSEAIELLEKAKALNPQNPRPWFVHGQNTLFTPAFFGGGEKNAQPLLEKSLALYKTHKQGNSMMPVWGKERCEKLLEQCKQ